MWKQSQMVIILVVQAVLGKSDQISCIETVTEGSNAGSSNVDSLQNVADEGVALISGLRANSSIPYYVLPDSVDSCNQIFGIMKNAFENQLCDSLAAANCGSEVVANIMQSMQSNLAGFENPFAFLSSNYKCNK